MSFPLALDEGGWKKGGQDVTLFPAVPGSGDTKHGVLPMLRMGAFEIPNVPGIFGAPIAAVEKEAGIDLDGFAGSGLFATFRLTFADEGRTLWLEDLPPDVIAMRRALAEKARTRAVPPRELVPEVPGVSPLPPAGDKADTKPKSSDNPPPKAR